LYKANMLKSDTTLLTKLALLAIILSAGV